VTVQAIPLDLGPAVRRQPQDPGVRRDRDIEGELLILGQGEHVEPHVLITTDPVDDPVVPVSLLRRQLIHRVDHR